jgi:hypothetical protein
MRAIVTAVTFVAMLVAACLIGFGIPLGWIWIGSQLQGDSGATTTSFSVAMVILFGIIASYVLLLYIAGIVMAVAESRGETEIAPRAPWMRGQTETRPAGSRRTAIDGVERLFVVTTIVVTIAFWLWFAFVAGSPLPNQ